MEPDFSGYATKAGLACTDGRTIMPDAFKHQDGEQVPLLWQHDRKDPDNVLGYGILRHRDDGTYIEAYLNDTPKAITARKLVKHTDIQWLSIYANELVERGKQVYHGAIREVSLVVAGANPGAKIDFVAVQHADGYIEAHDDEAFITTGIPVVISHDGSDDGDDELSHEDISDIYESLTETQQEFFHYMLTKALEHSDEDDSSDVEDEDLEDDLEDDADGDDNNDTDGDDEPDDAEHSDEGDALEHQEGQNMSRNIFEKKNDDEGAKGGTLSHSDIESIFAAANAGDRTTSFMSIVKEKALEHGIENAGALFPDFKATSATPEWNKRRTEWVSGVINGVRKSPFARIKTLIADLTFEDARARGYITGMFKKEEFFSLSQRTTAPTMVYKKQKLDRETILEITDFDIVSWMRMEMRMMIEEEIARAILISDGRPVDHEDKIKDPAGAIDGVGIRSILKEHELYATTVYVNDLDAGSKPSEVTDAIALGRRHFRGSGTPTFYTTENWLTPALLERDADGRRLYRNVSELADELRVAAIVPVEVMESVTDLVGIMVYLPDYTLGSVKGGELTMFDDFDINYNQYLYLIETFLSGALTKLKSAIVVKRTASTSVLLPTPAKLTLIGDTSTFTVPTVANVSFRIDGVVQTAGVKDLVDVGSEDESSDENASVWTANVVATPDAGYHFANSADPVSILRKRVEI